MEGLEVVVVGDGEDACGGGLPAEFVEVEGDAVGAVEAVEFGAVGGAEEEGAAVGGVDVEFGSVGGAEVGDVVEGVDLAGVGGACGGGDEEALVVVSGEGFFECGEVHDAGGGGDGEGFGEAEEPGGAVDAVVGVGGADGLYGAVAFAGEEEGELVGFGAAGGDEGVGVGVVGVDLVGECGGGGGFEG